MISDLKQIVWACTVRYRPVINTNHLNQPVFADLTKSAAKAKSRIDTVVAQFDEQGRRNLMSLVNPGPGASTGPRRRRAFGRNRGGTHDAAEG